MSQTVARESEHAAVASIPNDSVCEERERLLRFCTRLTGRSQVAEDLVQETLLEAWRHEEQLRNPERRAQWLFGIARNVFLRWKRGRGRDVLARAADLVDDVAESGDDLGLEPWGYFLPTRGER